MPVHIRCSECGDLYFYADGCRCTPNPEQKPVTMSLDESAKKVLSDDEYKKLQKDIAEDEQKPAEVSSGKVNIANYEEENLESCPICFNEVVVHTHDRNDGCHNTFSILCECGLETAEWIDLGDLLRIWNKRHAVERLQTQLKNAEAQRDKALEGLEVYAYEDRWRHESCITAAHGIGHVKRVFVLPNENGYEQAQKTIAEVEGMKDE